MLLCAMVGSRSQQFQDVRKFVCIVIWFNTIWRVMKSRLTSYACKSQQFHKHQQNHRWFINPHCYNYSHSKKRTYLKTQEEFCNQHSFQIRYQCLIYHPPYTFWSNWFEIYKTKYKLNFPNYISYKLQQQKHDHSSTCVLPLCQFICFNFILVLKLHGAQLIRHVKSFLFLYHMYTFQIKASDFGKKVRFKVRLHAGIHMNEII